MSSDDLLVRLKKVLNDYSSDVSGIDSVFIATLDGHLLLHSSKVEHPLEQLTPIAGSVLGISETLATQLLDQQLQDNIVIMEKNIIGLFKVNDKEDSLYLGVICDRLINLGKVITFAKLASKNINTILKNQI